MVATRLWSASSARLDAQSRKRTVAFLGHSFQAAAFGSAGSGVQYTTGYPGWLPILSRQRISVKNALNFAVAGETSTQIMARVPSIVAAAPGACIIDCITNDTALSFATITSNLAYIIGTLRDAQIAPIMVLWTGRTGITTAQYQNFLRVNEWLRTTYGSAPGVYLADPNELFTDPATGAPRPGYDQGDGLHPSNAGGYYFAQPIMRALEHIFPAPLYPVSNVLDVYDATNNPNGNRLPGAGMMAGATGTKAGGVTGDVATGWTLTDANAGGATVVASKGAMADGRPAQVITLSGNYTGSNRYIEFTNTSSLHATLLGGQAVEFGIDFEVAVSSQNVSGVTALANLLTAAGNLFPSAGGGSAALPIPAVAYSGLIRNDRDSAIIPGGVAPTFSSFAVRLALVNVGVSTPVALTIKLSSASFKAF